MLFALDINISSFMKKNEIAKIWAFIMVEPEEFVRFNFWSKDQMTYQTNQIYNNINLLCY